MRRKYGYATRIRRAFSQLWLRWHGQNRQRSDTGYTMTSPMTTLRTAGLLRKPVGSAVTDYDYDVLGNLRRCRTVWKHAPPAVMKGKAA